MIIKFLYKQQLPWISLHNNYFVLEFSNWLIILEQNNLKLVVTSDAYRRLVPLIFIIGCM